MSRPMLGGLSFALRRGEVAWLVLLTGR